MLTMLLVLLALGLAVAQQATIQVPIDGKRFNLSFEVRSSPIDVAREFCIQQATELALTQENLPTCVRGVSQFIGNAVAETFNTAKVTVPTDKGAFDVTFRVDDKDAPANMATRLCAGNAELFGLTQETLNSCVAPVATFLNNAASQYIAQRTISFPIELNSVKATVNFRTDMDSPAKYSVLLCRENAAAFNISNEKMDECLKGVNTYVSQVLQKYVSEREVPVSLKIGENDFNLRVIPSRDGIISVSQKLCTEYRTALGIEEAGVPQCTEVVANAVLKNLQERVAAARAQQKPANTAAAATAQP